MTIRIRKATPQEKAYYQQHEPIYPLYGFAQIDGHNLIIEDLRSSWTSPDPIYEVRAPNGYIFAQTDTHSLLCHSINDIKHELLGIEVSVCNCEFANCAAHWAEKNKNSV